MYLYVAHGRVQWATDVLVLGKGGFSIWWRFSALSAHRAASMIRCVRDCVEVIPPLLRK